MISTQPKKLNHKLKSFIYHFRKYNVDANEEIGRAV